MTIMEEGDTRYLNELKEHFVNDLMNSMLAESIGGGAKFSRIFPLVSLVELYDGKDKEKFFDFKEIANRASRLGYKGAEVGLFYGLRPSIEAGIVEKQGDKKYRLSPLFGIYVNNRKEWLLNIIKMFVTRTQGRRP